ncbi:phage tail protein [Bradyrhizobium sp. Bra78]|uniref:phage tail protein n=1 Tax=Bradyrhizobium sp. Bra78 TaxID=2926010 RepID=UPI0021C96AC3|nr:tail fiber protein [Bradyrhizobium sp. Bra78]
MSNNGGISVWNKTATANASSDSTVNWAEGQSPSSVNDSARAMMASAARWRDDISGALVTTGTSAAYALTSNQQFVNLTDFASQVIAFTPHVTNAGGGVTMTVDGFANIPLRSAPNVELPAGVLIQGTPYVAVYNNTDHALYLQSFYGASPYLIPLGGMLDFIGLTAPNSQFALPFGQAISRTTYASLFATVGTTFGPGDGSTTFNIPDLRGRFIAGKDDMGGSAAGRIGNVVTDSGTINGATLGSGGGSATHALTTAEMPAHNHGVTDPGHTHATSFPLWGSPATGSSAAGGGAFTMTTAVIASATTGISVQNAGSGSAHAILPPTIVLSKILRII